jgi:hypothetical protein
LDHITVLPVEAGNFKDYHRFLSKFYRDYKAISNQHIFSCTKKRHDILAYAKIEVTTWKYLSEDIVPLKYYIIKPKFFGQDQIPIRGAPGEIQAMAAWRQIMENYETVILQISEFKKCSSARTTENSYQANITEK